LQESVKLQPIKTILQPLNDQLTKLPSMIARLNLTHVLLLPVFLLVVIFSSCKREDSQTSEQERQASVASGEADGEAEVVFNAVFDDVMGVNDTVGIRGTGAFGRNFAANTGGGPGTERPNACYTVTISQTTNFPFPKQIVIDFGTTGCLGPDGHTRRGKIIALYTNHLLVPGAMVTTTFDNFYLDSIKVEGLHKIKNTGTGAPSLTRQFTVDVLEGRLSKPNGNYIKWNSHKVITQFEGLVTHDFRDDIFRIEGSGNGQVKKGNLLVNWQSNITEPLVKKFTCRWLVKGRIRTVRGNNILNSSWVTVIDFGAGNCDNQAVLTINGVSHNITLP